MNVVRYPIMYLRGVSNARGLIRLPSGHERLAECLARSVDFPFTLVCGVDAVLEVGLRAGCASRLLLQQSLWLREVAGDDRIISA